MRWFVGSLLVITLLWALDRLLLRLEARGLLYYRRRRASPGTLSRAMMEVHAMLQPGTSHVEKAHDVRGARGEEEGRDRDPLGSSAPRR